MKFFNEAEIAQLSPDDAWAYHQSLKQYRDLRNSIDTARREGEQIGLAKRRRLQALRTGLRGLQLGLPPDVIADLVELSPQEIDRLQKLQETHGSRTEANLSLLL